MGAVCYADDVLLISPTRSVMQRMLFEMEAFAEEPNIMFNTYDQPSKSKSKCILDMYSVTWEIWSKMLLSREQDLFNLQLKLELCSSVLHQKR